MTYEFSVNGEYFSPLTKNVYTVKTRISTHPTNDSQRSPGSSAHGQPPNSNNRPGVQCRYFMNNGYCFYGENCTFLHSAGGTTGATGMSNGAISGKQDRFFNGGMYNIGPAKGTGSIISLLSMRSSIRQSSHTDLGN